MISAAACNAEWTARGQILKPDATLAIGTATLRRSAIVSVIRRRAIDTVFRSRILAFSILRTPPRIVSCVASAVELAVRLRLRPLTHARFQPIPVQTGTGRRVTAPLGAGGSDRTRSKGRQCERCRHRRKSDQGTH